MSIFGPAGFGGYGGFGFTSFSPTTMNVPLVDTVQPQPPAPDAKVPPKPGIDRSSAGWSMIASRGEMIGFDDAPPPSIDLFWQMRRYSTIQLAYAVTAGPIIAGKQTVECVNNRGKDDQAEKIKEKLSAAILPILASCYTAATECLQFGFWLHELIWGRVEGLTVPVEARPFLPGQVTMYQDRFQRFAGYQMGTEFRDGRYAFLAVNDPHIDPIFGYSRNRYCREEWWRARNSNASGDKLERKASGIQMQIKMPMGVTWDDAAGGKISNDAMAQSYVDAAAQGRCFVTPKTPFSLLDCIQKPELFDKEAISVEAFDWGNPGPSLEAHINRLDRLDRDIMRGWRRPEREAMQGAHGTQADAGAHGQVGITDSELVAAMILGQFSRQVIDPCVATNWGAEWRGCFIVKQAPLSDPQQSFLQELTKTLAASKDNSQPLLVHVDMRKLGEQLELPLRSEADVKKDLDAQKAQADAQQKAQADALTAKAGGAGGANGSGRAANGDGGSNGTPPGGGNGGGNGRMKIAASADAESRFGSGGEEYGELLTAPARAAVSAAARMAVDEQLPGLLRTAAASFAPAIDASADAAVSAAADLFGRESTSGSQQHLHADADGRWVTIDGVHVFISHGKITKGPAHLIGKSPSDLSNDAKAASAKAAEHDTPEAHREAAAAHDRAAAAHEKGTQQDIHTVKAGEHREAEKSAGDPMVRKSKAAFEASRRANARGKEVVTGGQKPGPDVTKLHREAAQAHSDAAIAAHEFGKGKSEAVRKQADTAFDLHSQQAQAHAGIADRIEARPLVERAKELHTIATDATEKADKSGKAAHHQAAAKANAEAATAYTEAIRANGYEEGHKSGIADSHMRDHANAAVRHAGEAARLEREPKEKAAAAATVQRLEAVSAAHAENLKSLDARKAELQAANGAAWSDATAAAKPDEPALRDHLEAGGKYSEFKKSPAHQAAVDRANAAQSELTAHFDKINAAHAAHQKELFKALVGDRPHNDYAFPVAVDRKPAGFAEMQPGIKAFQQLVGPNAKYPLAKLTTTGQWKYRGVGRGRSFAHGDTIYMSGGAGAATVVHELGHILENHDPGIRQRAQDFLARRTAGNANQRLSKMTGNRGYRKNEIAADGGFISPYVGKKYDSGHTEVISMGMEHMYRDPLNFAQKDPEHFALIHAIMHQHD